MIKQVVSHMFYYTSCGALAGKILHHKAGCITRFITPAVEHWLGNIYIIKHVISHMFYYTSCGALAGKRLHHKAGCIN